jgi:hypothetical protein
MRDGELLRVCECRTCRARWWLCAGDDLPTTHNVPGSIGEACWQPDWWEVRGSPFRLVADQVRAVPTMIESTGRTIERRAADG